MSGHPTKQVYMKRINYIIPISSAFMKDANAIAPKFVFFICFVDGALHMTSQQS